MAQSCGACQLPTVGPQCSRFGASARATCNQRDALYQVGSGATAVTGLGCDKFSGEGYKSIRNRRGPFPRL